MNGGAENPKSETQNDESNPNIETRNEFRDIWVFVSTFEFRI